MIWCGWIDTDCHQIFELGNDADETQADWCGAVLHAEDPLQSSRDETRKDNWRKQTLSVYPAETNKIIKTFNRRSRSVPVLVSCARHIPRTEQVNVGAYLSMSAHTQDCRDNNRRGSPFRVRWVCWRHSLCLFDFGVGKTTSCPTTAISRNIKIKGRSSRGRLGRQKAEAPQVLTTRYFEKESAGCVLLLCRLGVASAKPATADGVHK